MSESGIPLVSADSRDPIPLSYWEFLCSFINEIFRSPLNFILVAMITWLIYKIFQSKPRQEEPVQVTKELAKIRRDFTLEELKEYNGTGPDGRILIAVNGNVYDVTKGARFYGPGRPYADFGGRDASRSLATFSVGPGKDEYDDLSDLNTEDMKSMKEWEAQFKESYDHVGKLLKPGDAHTNYSDEEEESSQQENESKIKKE